MGSIPIVLGLLEKHDPSPGVWSRDSQSQEKNGNIMWADDKIEETEMLKVELESISFLVDKLHGRVINQDLTNLRLDVECIEKRLLKIRSDTKQTNLYQEWSNLVVRFNKIRYSDRVPV